jgi:hypothetical protein
MRVFWIILAIVVIAAAGYLALAGRGPGPSRTAQPQPARSPAPPIAETPTAPSAAIPSEARAPEPEVVKADPPPAPRPAAPQPDSGYSIVEGTVSPPGVTGTPTHPEAPEPVVAVPVETPKEPAPAEPAPAEPATSTADAAMPADAAPAVMFGEFEVTPSKVEKNADGSMTVDGRYTIKGEGTPESPYIVPWDLLISAEEVFDPQNAKKRLPERVTMFDGKHIRLSGYVAFPLVIREPKELLMMLNQWDGCCIGVPPTPYDAVEVMLKDIVEGDDRYATAGSVTGRFHVKPYLTGDWLIGLYTMEQATLTAREYGGAGAN